MTHNPSLIAQLHEINNQSITVVNGAPIPVEGKGKIELFDSNLWALYVPKLSSNLLYISKITKDLNCRAIFTTNSIIFQDCNTKKTISEGLLENGFYTLNIESTIPSSIALAAQDNKLPNLWHNRMGHPSNLILLKLFPFLNKKLDHCESCVLTKQCRIPFNHSDSKYNLPFLLVHSDV